MIRCFDYNDVDDVGDDVDYMEKKIFKLATGDIFFYQYDENDHWLTIYKVFKLDKRKEIYIFSICSCDFYSKRTVHMMINYSQIIKGI